MTDTLTGPSSIRVGQAAVNPRLGCGTAGPPTDSGHPRIDDTRTSGPKLDGIMPVLAERRTHPAATSPAGPRAEKPPWSR
ncbi:hypothetical protein AB0C02_29490 [Micromonospora sp. NPDC048999]|uniref:hypothetical protein n=1 Tax=Micromonospora sp. NPDC048999 TaxID=3155391 RepID=UPI0033E47C74